jgi:hypothetical protein
LGEESAKPAQQAAGKKKSRQTSAKVKSRAKKKTSRES